MAAPVTVTAAVPVAPPLDAVIVAPPAATPVTTPEGSTDAWVGSLLEKFTWTQAEMLFPPASSAFPVSNADPPTPRVRVGGVTLMLATTGGTDAGVFTLGAALKATLKRATCCASMILTTPSAV